MCPDADDEVFLHLRAGQTEPAGTRRLSCSQSKIWNIRIVGSKHSGHKCHMTHGACGAVWAAPGDPHPRRDTAVVPVPRPRMASSCPVLHPASCSGRRRTDVAAPEQKVQWDEDQNQKGFIRSGFTMTFFLNCLSLGTPFFCYLLGFQAETRLLPVGAVFGRAGERVLCHVLWLLHQLWRVHDLHGDDVEGIQILQTQRKTEFSQLPWWVGSNIWPVSWSAHLLLGRVVHSCQGNKAGDVVSFFL